jgi:hypothetical protein
MSQLLSVILSLMETHFLSEFMPRTFQQKTFQDLEKVLRSIKSTGEYSEA